jgi:hypothetical protein
MPGFDFQTPASGEGANRVSNDVDILVVYCRKGLERPLRVKKMHEQITWEESKAVQTTIR